MTTQIEGIIESLEELLNYNIMEEIKKKVLSIEKKIISTLQNDENITLIISSQDTFFDYNSSILLQELKQISETQTYERIIYYIKRLIKSITQTKTSKINDINLNRWKDYDDLLTDSLWVIEKRDSHGAHNAKYWGNFIPQIPNQFIRRYTKKNDWVLDTFLGSGTTLLECQRLERNGIGIELQPEVALIAQQNIEKQAKILENIPNHSQTQIVIGDATQVNYEELLAKNQLKKVQLLMMHPPYWDIIKFSDDERDMSNAANMQEFLNMLGNLVDKTYPILEKDRHLVLVISDKYEKGEWIPMAFYAMQEVMKRGYQLKSTIVKNFEETKAKMNQKELWRYRALVGGFYVFKHEYIFLFKKVKS